MRFRCLVAVMVIIALAGCDDRKDASAPAERTGEATADRLAFSRNLAETMLRAGVRGPSAMEFRGVQAYRQAQPDTIAVCGQLNVRGPGQASVPFVTVVSYPDGGVPRMDQMVAMSGVEATRVYLESLSRCLENGGPATTRRGAPPALPTIPNDLPYATGHASPRAGPVQIAVSLPGGTGQSGAAQNSTGFQPAAGEQAVVLRQPGNVRVHPSGGGEVLRVAPRGATLRVFGTAPGGWLKVGEDAPVGWLHISLVSDTAP